MKQYESEPYHQHQNKAEQYYGVVKMYINTLTNLTGAPAHCWLLCLVYVCAHLNVTASSALDAITPIQALAGEVPDISHFLQLSFCDPACYKVDENEPDHKFPSQSNEKRGHWVGLKVINLLGRYSLMKLSKLLQDLLSEVLPELLHISG